MYGESVIASEAKQSRENLGGRNQFAQLDCFVAEPVIGPATSGRTRWLLAMTRPLGDLKALATYSALSPFVPLQLRYRARRRG